jgi:hypothetical protein
MGYMSFQEYVEKAKEVKKPKVAVVPDYEGPHPDSPEKSGMPKNAGGIGPVGKPNPYKGGKNGPNPNKTEPGLLHKGDKKLVIKHAGHAPTLQQKVVDQYPKTTHEWLEQNKNLPLSSFTQKLRSERLAGLPEGSRPFQCIKEAVTVCASNPAYVLDTVLELKRAGLLEAFVQAIAAQTESIPAIAKVLETNEGYARKLLGFALQEMVAPPVGDEDAEEGHHDEEGEEGEEGHDEEGEEGHHDEEGEEGDMEGDEEGHHDDEDAEGDMEGDEEGAASMTTKDHIAKAMMNHFGKY